jgi:hypothetical protein
MLNCLVKHQGELIMELVAFNQQTHDTIQDLHARMRTIEATDVPRLYRQHFNDLTLAPVVQPTCKDRDASDARSRSPSPDFRDYRQRDAPGSVRMVKGRKNLYISIPGKMYAPQNIGLPTPKTLSAVCVSWHVLTKASNSLRPYWPHSQHCN